jgi:uncharacterized protein involved in exopolysaccharide biosynthesis
MKAPPSPRQQLQRLTALVRRAGAFWKRGLAVFIVGTLLAVPLVFTRPRSYQSETVILYQETIQAADVAGGESSSDNARRVGARLREHLFARVSLEPIIRDLQLYPDKVIHGVSVEAVDELRKHIKFTAQQDGDTYGISFVGSSPQEAQEVTRRLGDCIIQEASKRREDKAKTLKEVLSGESAQADAALRAKESDLTRFVLIHPEFAAQLQGLPAQPTSTSAAAAAARPPSSDPVVAALETRAASIERRLAAKPGATFQPPPDSAELVTARRALAEKLELFTDRHPEVIAARARLKTAEDAQATTNAAALAAWQAQRGDDNGAPPTPAEAATLRATLESLQGQIAARRMAAMVPADAPVDAGLPVTAPAPAIELDFRRLQGEVADARDRQQTMQSRLFRASITESSVMDDRNIQVSILDPAYLPVRAISKPRSLLLLAALALSFGLALGVVFASAALDDRIYDRQDIEQLDVPVIAIIPKPGDHAMRRLPQGPGPFEGR